MQVGDRVRFTGSAPEQVRWGGNDDPEGILEIGREYVVADVEVHSWHTKLTLADIPGRYNSVCFEPVGHA